MYAIIAGLTVFVLVAGYVKNKKTETKKENKSQLNPCNKSSIGRQDGAFSIELYKVER
jgi:hypothetical protein